MGFRFRKSISFGGLVRLNLSGSGVSLGLGPRGLNVNIGPKGVRKTIGLPGSGISYQTFSRWSPGAPPASAGPTTQPPDVGLPFDQTPAAPRHWGAPIVKILVIGLFVLGAYLLLHRPGTEPVRTSLTPAPDKTQVPSQLTPAEPAKAAAPLSAVTPSAPLTFEEVRDVQDRLKALAFDPGPSDGIPGPLTTTAIKKYEAARRRTETGNLDRSLLEALRREPGQAIK